MKKIYRLTFIPFKYFYLEKKKNFEKEFQIDKFNKKKKYIEKFTKPLNSNSSPKICWRNR